MKIKDKHKLRKPGGPHIVGCTQFVFEYNAIRNSGKKRIIPCICFYPAKDKGHGKLKKYAGESILPGGGGIVTNSYIKAPIGEDKYPLILFNHGLGFGCEANTVQCEELSSYGYIVLSIGHEHDGFYQLPGGEILLFDEERMDRDYGEESSKALKIVHRYISWLKSCGKDADIHEHRDYYKKIIESQPKITAQSEIWVKDNLVALDMFLAEADQENSAFYNHLDRENIGAFGMSFGGSAALNLTHASPLVKAAANLDGFFYSAMCEEPLKKPVLLLQNDTAFSGYLLTFPFLNAENDAYLVTVKNTAHGNFMDYNEILSENSVSKITVGNEEFEIKLLGEIDPDKIETIMNTLLLDFFNKYLKGRDSKVIDKEALQDDVILNRK